jgi:hypothetical protein
MSLTELNHVLDLKLLVLLACANGSPVIAKALLGAHGAVAVDRGLRLSDGERLLGPSKTVRGLLLALLVTTALSMAIGLGWRIGLLVATAAMAGDLASSFIKRRLTLPASSRATGLDQIPESMLPLLVCARPLDLSSWDIAATALCFFAGEVVLSKLLYRLHLRERPY